MGLHATWGFMQGWLDAVSIGILSLLYFCFGWTFIAVLLLLTSTLVILLGSGSGLDVRNSSPA